MQEFGATTRINSLEDIEDTRLMSLDDMKTLNQQFLEKDQ